MVTVKVVYPIDGVTNYYPEITGPYATVEPYGPGVKVTVRNKRHGHILRSVYFDKVISVDRQFSGDHYGNQA